MGGIPPKMFPVPGSLGQSDGNNVLNQSVAPKPTVGPGLIGLSQMNQSQGPNPLQQPAQPRPGLNPLRNNPLYGGGGRGRYSQF